jgi:hypothetical protein
MTTLCKARTKHKISSKSGRSETTGRFRKFGQWMRRVRRTSASLKVARTVPPEVAVAAAARADDAFGLVVPVELAQLAKRHIAIPHIDTIVVPGVRVTPGAPLYWRETRERQVAIVHV